MLTFRWKHEILFQVQWCFEIRNKFIHSIVTSFRKYQTTSSLKMTMWADNVKFVKDIVDSKYAKIETAAADVRNSFSHENTNTNTNKRTNMYNYLPKANISLTANTQRLKRLLLM